MAITPPYKLVHPGIPQTSGDDAGMFLDQSGDMVMASPMFDLGGAVFNVKHPKFGAVGDGVADDAAAIQAAIDAADTAGGGKVLLPGPTFGIKTVLNLQNNVSLIGSNRGGTAIKMLVNGTRTLAIAGKSDIRISNLILDGNSGSLTTGGVIADELQLHITLASTNIVIDGVTFQNGLTRYAHLEGSSGNFVENVTFRDCVLKNGGPNEPIFCVRFCKSIDVLGCDFNDAGDDKSVEFNAVIGGTIAFNRFTNGGVVILERDATQAQNTEGVSIHHNRFVSTKADQPAIKMEDSDYCSCHHNYIEDASSYGILVRGCKEAKIHHNWIKQCSLTGILVDDAGTPTNTVNNGTEICYNYINNANNANDVDLRDKWAINVEDNTGHVLIMGNTIEESNGFMFGIQVTLAQVEYKVLYNDFSGVSTAQVFRNSGVTGSPRYVIDDNRGFRLKNHGVALIASGNSSVTVASGMNGYSTAVPTQLTFVGALNGMASLFNTASGTNIIINANTTAGGNTEVSWRADQTTTFSGTITATS